MAGYDRPIILSGFDRDKQLTYDFKNKMFAAFWGRRVYTHETSHRILNPGRSTPQEIRYGNNITVLLQACCQLRYFYGYGLFWKAVASGFGTMSAEVAKERAFAFMDARSTFLSKGGPPDYTSAATRAADDFILFIDICDSDPTLPCPTAPLGDLWPVTTAFFKSKRDSLVDSARVTFEGEVHTSLAHISARFAPQPVPRKRSPSASPPGQPSSAKRRQFSDAPDRSDTSGQSRAPQSLPPLAIGKQIRGTAKQESCQTPSTAQDGTTPDGHFSQGTLDRPVELRIRGTATTANSQSPSQGLPNGTKEEHSVPYEDLRRANITLQVRVHALEREKEKREEASKAMDAKFALLEQRMNAFETKPARDDKPINDMETKLAPPNKQLQQNQKQSPDRERTDWMDMAECLEKATEPKFNRPEDTEAFQNLRHMVESLNTRVTDTKARVAALERLALTPNEHNCDRDAGRKALMERLERQVTSLQTKVASIETRQGPDKRIGVLDGRINAVQENLKELQEKVDEQALQDLLEALKDRPTSASVSKQIKEVEQVVLGLVDTFPEELMKRVKEVSNNAFGSAASGVSTRVDELAEGLDRVNTALQNVQKVPATVQHAQPSSNTTEVLGRLDELSETVNGIVQREARLTFPADLDDLVRRVAIVERILRNLRDAY